MAIKAVLNAVIELLNFTELLISKKILKIAIDQDDFDLNLIERKILDNKIRLRFLLSI